MTSNPTGKSLNVLWDVDVGQADSDCRRALQVQKLQVSPVKVLQVSPNKFA